MHTHHSTLARLAASASSSAWSRAGLGALVVSVTHGNKTTLVHVPIVAFFLPREPYSYSTPAEGNRDGVSFWRIILTLTFGNRRAGTAAQPAGTKYVSPEGRPAELICRRVCDMVLARM
jgi:hypothetical protein